MKCVLTMKKAEPLNTVKINKNNTLAISDKFPKKQITSEKLKKPLSKILVNNKTNLNSNNQLISSLKAPYKSNPVKSSVNNLNDDCSKEDYHSNKLPSEKGCNILSTPTKKDAPKNINLWQKKTSLIGNTGNKCCNKNILIKSNCQNNPLNTTSNYIPTENYENKCLDKPIYTSKVQVMNKLTNSSNDKPKIKRQNNSNTNKTLGSNIVTTNFTENRETIISINTRNDNDCKSNEQEIILNKEMSVNCYSKHEYRTSEPNIDMKRDAFSENSQPEILSSIFNFKKMLNSEKNNEKVVHTEDNLTKINNLNKMLSNMSTCESPINTNHINVINANMLDNDYTPEKTIPIKNEILINSEMRMKRYGILLDFINSNLKEINDIVTNQNNDELGKIDEVNSNRLSSLHSKINLNSKTNIYDYEDSEMHENVANLPKVNLNNNKTRYINQDITRSLLISSINSDFYQDLIDGSFNFAIGHNISNDMSTIKTFIENKKFDRYINENSKRVSETPKFEDGDENVDSDIDKTKEIIQLEPKKFMTYNNIDKNKVNPLSHNIKIVETKNIEETKKEEKSSKCIIF